MTLEHLWGETYERDLKDVLPLQGEVARAIASQIKVTLSPEEQSRLPGSTAYIPTRAFGTSSAASACRGDSLFMP